MAIIKDSLSTLLLLPPATYLEANIKNAVNDSREPIQVLCAIPNSKGEYVFADGDIFTKLPNPDKWGSHITIVNTCNIDDGRGVSTGVRFTHAFSAAFKPNKHGHSLGNGRDVSLTELYFGGCRLDGNHQLPGNENVINEVVRRLDVLTNYYGLTHVSAADAHFANNNKSDPRISEYPFQNIQTMPTLETALFVNNGRDEVKIIGADGGAGKKYDKPHGNKVRINDRKVEFTDMPPPKGIMAIEDDILATGTTLCQIADYYAQTNEVDTFNALITHPVLIEGMNCLSANPLVNNVYVIDSRNPADFKNINKITPVSSAPLIVKQHIETLRY